MGNKRQRRRAGPHGIVCVDKPEGPTSHTVVRQMKRRFGSGRVGHAGTLDPMATGVLVVLLGEATKLSQWVVAHDKVYDAEITLGQETDTDDRMGQVLAQCEVPNEVLDRDLILTALATFTGEQEQVPPRFSAIRIGGRRLMEAARAGEEIEAPPRRVQCYSITLLDVSPPRIQVRVHCGSGYYIRALARDLGRKLGVGAHLSALRRIRSGTLTVDQAVAPEDAQLSHFVSISTLLPDVHCFSVGADEAEALSFGRPIAGPSAAKSEQAIAFDTSGRPLAMLIPGDASDWKIARGLHWGTPSAADDSATIGVID